MVSADWGGSVCFGASGCYEANDDLRENLVDSHESSRNVLVAADGSRGHHHLVVRRALDLS